MAIVTSTRPEHFALVHERTGIREHFELVLTRADYTRSKPDPEPYLMAADGSDSRPPTVSWSRTPSAASCPPRARACAAW